MRISRERVAENRERLLKVAIDQFREHGIDGVGLADIVKEAGMSLGSFYGYFESKEQLVGTACANAIGATDRLLSGSLSTTGKDSYSSTVDRYLSMEHNRSVARGCVFAALGAEIAHQSAGVRNLTSPALETLFGNLAVKVPGKTAKRRRALALSTMASLMGGLILSRMMDSPEQSKEVLDAVRAAMKNSVKATSTN